MAIIREELQGIGVPIHVPGENGQPVSLTAGVYDGIVERASDLQTAAAARFKTGSLMYALADHSVYVKTDENHWEAVGV